MSLIKASKFFHYWTAFTADQIILPTDCPTLEDLWEWDKEWTKATIGTTHSANTNSPFGNFMKERLGHEWDYWNEDRNVDLALAKEECMRFTSFQDSNYDPMHGNFYPPVYDVLIEHKAAGSISWQEMVKLIHMRAKLKVVITYTWDEGDKRSQPLIEHMTKAFGDMIAQANEVWPENGDTRYLLIFGQKGKDELYWIGTEFNAAGAVQEMMRKTTPL